MKYNIFEKMSNNGLLLKAINSNDMMYVIELVSNGKCELTTNNNEALKLAIRKENYKIVDYILKDFDVLSTIDWDELDNKALSIQMKQFIKRIKSIRLIK